MSDPHFKTPMDAIGDLLVRAWKYDDKPHQLFSCIRAMAEQYQTDLAMRAEIVRLMDYAYDRRGAPAPTYTNAEEIDRFIRAASSCFEGAADVESRSCFEQKEECWSVWLSPAPINVTGDCVVSDTGIRIDIAAVIALFDVGNDEEGPHVTWDGDDMQIDVEGRFRGMDIWLRLSPVALAFAQD